MVNTIHRWLHPVTEGGWDPIPSSFAEHYDQFVTANLSFEDIDRAEQVFGKMKGKRVLDLGGGPGHFTVELAKRGPK